MILSNYVNKIVVTSKLLYIGRKKHMLSCDLEKPSIRFKVEIFSKKKKKRSYSEKSDFFFFSMNKKVIQIFNYL